MRRLFAASRGSQLLGLAAGESRELSGETMPETGLFGGIQWVNRMHYDHARGAIVSLGKVASAQSIGGVLAGYCCAVYTLTTNSWSAAASTPGFNPDEIGHVYESTAYDPIEGRIYTGLRGDTSGRFKYLAPEASKTSWTVTSGYGSKLVDSLQAPAAWHPNLFGAGNGGIVTGWGPSSSPAQSRVVAWRRSDGQWFDYTPETSYTGAIPYRGTVEYVRSLDACLVSFNDPEAGTKNWVIPAGSGGSRGTAYEWTEGFPLRCTYTDNTGPVGMLIDGPDGTGPYVLEKNGTNQVWKWTGTAWDSLDPHPFPYGAAVTNNGDWHVASCYPLGVFLCRGQVETEPSIVWKPSA